MKRPNDTDEAYAHSNPDTIRCDYFVVRKKRFCRTEKRSGGRFCPTHENDAQRLQTQPKNETTNYERKDSNATPEESRIDLPEGEGKDSQMIRVPCPINPNHTVYANRLAKHVLVCPDLRFDPKKLPYYELDRHANQWLKSNEDSNKHIIDLHMTAASNLSKDESMSALVVAQKKRVTHHHLQPDHLSSLIQRITAAYFTAVEPYIVPFAASVNGMESQAEHEGVIPDKHIPTKTEEITEANSKSDDASDTKCPLESVVSSNAEKQHDNIKATSSPLVEEGVSKKHGPQHKGLVQCLDIAIRGFCRNNNTNTIETGITGAESPLRICGFVELGAGKGGLSYALHDQLQTAFNTTDTTAVASVSLSEGKDTKEPSESSTIVVASWKPLLLPKPTMVVVDIGTFRRKKDGCVRMSTIPMVRLRLNIKDLNFSKAVLHIQEEEKELQANDRTESENTAIEKQTMSGNHTVSEAYWVAHGKHLCGACTDFSLSCVTRDGQLHRSQSSTVSMPDTSDTQEAKSAALIPLVGAVVIATCCHHLCELRHMNPCIAVRSEDATVHLPGSDLHLTEAEFSALVSMTSWAVSGEKAVSEEKRRVGVYCKRIIDTLRLSYLKQQGFKYAALHEYATRTETEETVCIVAYR